MDIYSVLVLKRGVGPFPRSYTSTTTAQLNITGLNPGSTESIEEVCLSSYRALRKVCCANLSNIDLRSSARVQILRVNQPYPDS